MFFILSFVYVLVVLYTLANEDFYSSANISTIKDLDTEKKRQIEDKESFVFSGFDFETLISPNELSILTDKTKELYK